MKNEAALTLPITLAELTKVLVFTTLTVLSFFVPFTIGHPQLLVGIIVNACLFLSVIFLPKKYYLPIIVMPSLGLLARGIVFGSLTPFLIYFLPFIWLGNLVLVLAFKKLFSTGSVSIITAAGAKFLFLFIVANIYFNFHLVPKLFLQSMGMFQLFTALIGGFVALIILKIYGKHYARN